MAVARITSAMSATLVSSLPCRQFRYDAPMLVVPLAIVVALLISLTPPPPPPSDPPAEAATPEQQPSSVLATLTPASRSAVLRRAPFVYELPDGSIWDGYYYHEFRRVLNLYDTTSTSRPSVPAECRAWGFTAKHRAPGGRKHRPHPLWTSVQAKDTINFYTPFIYIDSTAPTPHEREAKPHAEVGKRLGLHLYEIKITEFPTDAISGMSLPHSFPVYGHATLPVLVPPQMKLKAGDSIKAEFFLITDPSIEVPSGAKQSTRKAARLVFAKDLRISPDRYAAALLDGRAELVEWTWKRQRTAMGDEYVWTRTVVPIETTRPAEAE